MGRRRRPVVLGLLGVVLGAGLLLAWLLGPPGCVIACASTPPDGLATPRRASDFADSVGVVTHIVYYDTAYADWPRVVGKLEELGVRHVREGVYGNPAPEWREWNERYYRAVELAAARGMRFTFGMGRPGSETGSLDELMGVVAGRLRPAAEALEAPNEFEKYVGGDDWPTVLASYTRALYAKAKAHPDLRSLPVLGPSFATTDGPFELGDQREWLDLGNVHPYTGGQSPDPDHLESERIRAQAVSGRKPVWATEAGFHNALASTDNQPPVSEAAAAVYILRTFLEHFDSGIARTYAYELLDEKPEPAGRDAEQHFGLLRNDFSPKPAFTALKNLLTLVGRDEGPVALDPLRLRLEGDEDLRHLVLQKDKGTYLVALWRLASVWDRDERRPLRVGRRRVVIELPDAVSVALADPIASAETRERELRRGRVHLDLAGRPAVLVIKTRRSD